MCVDCGVVCVMCVCVVCDMWSSVFDVFVAFVFSGILFVMCLMSVCVCGVVFVMDLVFVRGVWCTVCAVYDVCGVWCVV